MSNFPRPALPDLIVRVTQQVQINLPGITPMLRRAVTGVVAKVLAQELLQEYAYLDFIADQFFTVTATGTYLDRKGAEVGVPRQPGVFSAGAVTFPGLAPTGGVTTIIPAGAVLQTIDQTQSFVLGTPVSIGTGGTGSGAVTAQTLGDAANLAAGTPLVLVVAVPGALPNVVVGPGGLTGGLDVQSDADYRAAILQAQQQPPQGGANRDYVRWAKLQPGVTRAWVYPLARGAGTVDVAAVFDGRGPGTSAIIPNAADLAAIQAILNVEGPVTASINAVALTAQVVGVVISNLVPLTGFTKAQAATNAVASLTDLFSGATAGAATYGDGIQPGQTGGTLFVEQISDAITQSVGVASFDLTSPSSDEVATSEAILVLGPVTTP